MSKRSDEFVKAWVGQNVHTIPGLDDFHGEAERLTDSLIVDAQSAGLSVSELQETTGDIEDFMLNAYEQIHDPELGFKG